MDKKTQGLFSKTKATALEVKEGTASLAIIENKYKAPMGVASFGLPWADGGYNVKAAGKALQLAEDAKNVPELPAMGVPIVTIDNRDALAQFVNYAPIVSLSKSGDETRYIMNGLAIEREHIVATDGRTLSSYKFNAPLWAESGELNNIILPYGPMLAYSIKKFTLSKIELFKDASRVSFSIRFFFVESGLVLHIACIDGQFPNWTRIVPEYRADDKIGLTIPDKKTLSDHITLFKIKKDGTNRAEFKNDAGQSVFFNVHYMMRALDSGVSVLWGIDPSRAHIGTSGALTYIVMPMQAN